VYRVFAEHPAFGTILRLAKVANSRPIEALQSRLSLRADYVSTHLIALFAQDSLAPGFGVLVVPSAKWREKR
jgi:hypothetical protein